MHLAPSGLCGCHRGSSAVFDGDRYTQITSVVMPNHIHALFVQNPDWPLEKLLHTWKSFTARKINALLKRSGSLWQRDYFDRLVRDQGHFANCVRYIRRNPEKGNLRPGEYILYENEIAQCIEQEKPHLRKHMC
jgi:putative transposase